MNQPKEKPAKGTVGFLLYGRSSHFFRVYNNKDPTRLTFKDYKIHHGDLEVVILSGDAVFRDNVLDHSAKVLGKKRS